MQLSPTEIQNLVVERQKTFEEMKITLSESKHLIQMLKEAKHKFICSENNHIDFTFQNNDKMKDPPTQASTPYTPFNKKSSSSKKQNKKPKIQFIRQNIIGLCTRYTSPYDIELQTVYIDHTATNRAYAPVQTMINYTKRFMANPHTEHSHFGKFSTQMMHYAIKSLLNSFNADPQKFIILPTGSGSTGAVEKAIRLIQKFEDPDNKPQIFITPYEHHSNILPWVEFYGGITNLKSDERFVLEMEKIQDQIKASEKKNIIVSVSAASNVTSQLTDLYTLNSIIKRLKKVKNLIFAVDCAAFCCHQELDVEELDQIDFAFISPHKNLGGAQACGLLLVRKSIIASSKPTFPGGGTVTVVTGYEQKDIIYDLDVFNRQVAGTPPFLGFYRAALSFELLKGQIGYDFIHERQKHNSEMFLKLLMEENVKFKNEGHKTSIVIYGHCDMDTRANVFTINIVNNGQMKNHNFISEIFSDIFGLQVRSGCFCAGPFSMLLLKLDKKIVDHMTPIMSLGMVKEKPGYIRMDLAFYLQDYEIEYIAKAIALTARYCQNMDPIYTICNDGEIKRHKLYKEHYPDDYELRHYLRLGEDLKKFEESDLQMLMNRKKTLENQLIRGQKILKDPLGFLKSQIYARK